MFIAILSGFTGSIIAPLVHQARKSASGWIVALVPLSLFIYFLMHIRTVASGSILLTAYEWVPTLNISLAFSLDGLSLLFALLITGIGTLVVIYGSGYLAGHEYLGRFYLLVLMFMTSMLGLVLADNLLTLFVFWELTSITSYLLIGFKHQEADSRSLALQAFLVTGGGGLALLAGLVLLGTAGGSYQLSDLLDKTTVIQNHPYYLPALVLIVSGAFAKSAQFPFHFWLPNAMAAPTPVSAYLHSATMVKAGIYILARLHPALSGTVAWETLVTGGGLITMLIGAFFALNNTDLKRILAYSTISALGTMVFLLGFDSSKAVTAAMVFLLAHALYKGALFMIAGAVDHETGTRDVSKLGGLRNAMPLMAVVAALAAVSMAGLGPVLSFIGKELLFESVLAAESLRTLFAVSVVLASAVSVTVAGIVTLRPFWGARQETPQKPHDPPPSLWIGPAIMAAVGLVLGLVPSVAERYLAAPAAAAILLEAKPIKLALWHGFNTALLMSGIAIALGMLVYLGWETWRRGMSRLEKFIRWGPEAVYGWSIILLNWIATRQTRILQNGYLRFYLLTIIVVTVSLAGTVLIFFGGFHLPDRVSDIYFYEVILSAMIVIAAFAALRSPSRLGAVASLGVVGYSIALIFLLYGAPDLAMTQFLIESITVVMFVFAFYRLPRFNPLGPPGPRVLHAIIGIITGMVMTALVLSAVQVNTFPTISSYFVENSVALAHGRNVVNVILVDFRGLDTLGEITVLAVAATGVLAILRFRRKDNR